VFLRVGGEWWIGEIWGMQYVYILGCNSGKTYVGCTGDLKKRVMEHGEGKVTFTRGHLPIKLLFYCAFVDAASAFSFEKYLKSGSGRAFMQRHLINNNDPGCGSLV
jgi:predicted GIY-YIG superfamily endonuclease